MWDFPHDGGATIKYGKTQIAVFHFASRGEWYACQNMCPHRREFVLSRGILGDQNGKPKVACPVHKKTFSLESGKCLSGEDYSVQVFPVKVEGDDVFCSCLPSEELTRCWRRRDLQRTATRCRDRCPPDLGACHTKSLAGATVRTEHCRRLCEPFS